MAYRLGVDIGGTFTDVVLIGEDGSLATKKVSSTPADYGVAPFGTDGGDVASA